MELSPSITLKHDIGFTVVKGLAKIKKAKATGIFICVWCFLSGVALLGCSSPEQVVQLTAQSKVVAFGDSLTKGTGVSLLQSYPSVLSAELGIEVVNRGVPGELSAEGLTRLADVMNKQQPDLVILCHGGNDLLRKRSLSQLKANLAKMIELIHAQGAEVLIIGVPKPALMLSPVPLYSELAEEYQLVAEMDILSELLSQRSKKSDQVHLNQAGYAEFARAISQKISVD